MERSNVCTYCGESAGVEREHVIPAAFYATRSFDPNNQWIVPACRICNSFAGSSLFFSIPEKARYLSKRYKRKYKKLLRIPFWSQEELEEMSYKLRVGIESSMLMRLAVLRRISFLDVISDYGREYMRPQWVEEEYKKYRKEMAKYRKTRKPKKKYEK